MAEPRSLIGLNRPDQEAGCRQACSGEACGAPERKESFGQATGEGKLTRPEKEPDLSGSPKEMA
jgi:hypothetical protein